MTTPAEASRGMCDGGTGWDGDRLAHNPEVEGSNPAPATSFRRSRPFPSRERAFCVSDVVLSLGSAELRVFRGTVAADPQVSGLGIA